MSWCECLRRPADPGFTLIETPEQAVAWFRRYTEGWTQAERAAIRRDLGGKNLACWCALPEPGQPDNCHAAVLLEIANRDE